MPKKIYNWKAVQGYHDDGHGFVECAQKFGFCHTAWNNAIKRGALRVAPTRFEDRRRRYDWTEVQAYYDAGFSYRQCSARFGFCSQARTKAVQRGEMKPRSNAKSVEEVLTSKSSRYFKKAKLIREGWLFHRCENCGISEWRGKRLVIQIDHINGVKNDWRLENLRMLCPNCHSQTGTFSGRNVKRPSVARAEDGSVV
jgi:5-methylcytosine-specific restriction endonuclease McrA